MSALGACCGALVGLGLTLLIASFLRRETSSFDRHDFFERFSPLRFEHGTVRFALGLGAGVLLGGITGWPVLAVIGVLGGLGLPGLFAKSRAGSDAIARVEAIAAWTEMLHDTLAGAAGLEQAILASAPVAPEPIRAEIVTLAARLEHERPGPALRALADEMSDPTMDLVVAALLLASEHQAARLGELLGRLAESARSQATMRLRVETGRSRQRTSVKVAVGMTIGLGAFMTLLDRSYLAPFGSALGQFVLALIGACFTLAFIWLGRITRSGPVPRLLRSEARLGTRPAGTRP